MDSGFIPSSAERKSEKRSGLEAQTCLNERSGCGLFKTNDFDAESFFDHVLL
jgi:hypothetical protein